MIDALKAAIRDRLVARGWSPEAYTAVARKSYDTAVGEKDAHAYVADFGPENDGVLLQGDYQSEGSNVLGSCSTCIPRNADMVTLNRLVDHFASQVDKAVSESYAAKLWLKFGHRSYCGAPR